jgi:hypothetical protein
MEANHYRFESDQAMFVNLNGSDEVLKQQQALIQARIAKLTMDLTVITGEIVERAKNEPN